jgi:hypothetical protein
MTGSNRVQRGGNWNNNAQNCRSANRNNNIGFRLASAPLCQKAGVHGRSLRALVVTLAAVPCPAMGTKRYRPPAGFGWLGVSLPCCPLFSEVP